MYLQVIPQGLFMGGAASFAQVFLVRLGAAGWLVSLNTSLPALIMMLAVLPMGALMQRQRRLARAANLARVLYRSVFAAFALLPFLPPAIAPYGLVALRGLGSIPQAALNVSYTTILGQATTPRRRARMLSTRMAVMRLVMALVGFLAGRWLDAAPFPLNYQLLFASALLASLGSAYIISKLRLPDSPEPSARDQGRLDLRAIPALIRRAPAFRNYLIARLFVQVGVGLALGLIPLYRVRNLGASDARLGILLTVQHTTQVIVYLALGRLLRKPVVRRRLWISCLGMALLPFTTALATTPEMLILPTLVIGVFGAAMTIFYSDTLIAVSPEEQRPIYVSISTFVLQAISFIMPLLGAALADLINIRFALFFAAGVRGVGALSFWWLGARRGRAAKPSAVARSD